MREGQNIDKLLSAETERLKGIIDSAAEGISVVGQDYRIHFQNKRLRDRFGDLTGKTCYKELMGFGQPCPSCPMVSVIQNNRAERVELTSANGRAFLVTFTPFRDADGEQRIVESARDITKHKQAKEYSQQSEQNLRAYLENAPDAVYINDLKGTFLYGNKKMARSSKPKIGEKLNGNYLRILK